VQLILRGGVVVDGTGGPARRADVRVVGDRILEVGPDLRGDPSIDCGGLVVAPGFIDTHSHSDLKLFEDPRLSMKATQGVTTEVLGQDGISVAPVRTVADTRRQLSGLLGDPRAAKWDWETVADYLEALRRLQPAPNVAYLVPHGTLRAYVMGSEARAPSDDELDRMCRVLDESLAAGAIGLSTGLIYPPCCYAERAELVALGKITARRGGPLVVHMRSESDYIVDAIGEMVDVGRKSGCAIHISHWKIAGAENFMRVAQVIAAVESAQAEGLRITCDAYPYAAGSTVLGAVLPPWAHDGGPPAALRRLADPETRQKMRAEMNGAWPQPWDNFWRWTGPEGIVIADVPSGRRPEVIGKTLAEAAGAAGAEALDFTFDLLLSEELGVGMVSHSQSEAVNEQLLQRPYVNVCTDGLLGGRPHPRAYGSYPKILARMVREKKLLTLEEAIRKMTSQAASAMNLQKIGRLEPGASADVVVFDPATIEDRATFVEPTQLSVGVAHVLVGGKPAAERPGRVVTREMP
jgi:N-acyl-D-amino-acid deacylase